MANRDTVDHAEHSGIGPDAKRERDYRDRGECWAFPQLPQRVAKILCQSAHQLRPRGPRCRSPAGKSQGETDRARGQSRSDALTKYSNKA